MTGGNPDDRKSKAYVFSLNYILYDIYDPELRPKLNRKYKN